MVFRMRIWLLTFHLLLPCISVYGYIEKANTMVPCGAPGGYCKVNCHSGYNGDYGGYFEVCDLVEINYSGVSESETGLDLSSLSLNLASIPFDCVDGVFPKHRIQSLILAHNLFYEEYDPSSISLSPLRDFIANFPNLRSLNLSNITTGSPERNVQELWQNNLNLTTLDISNNRNWWKIHSGNSSFEGMVNLRQLKLGGCCQELASVSEDFFRDLVNLHLLDVSANSWNLSQHDSLFFTLQQLKKLNASGLKTSHSGYSPSLPDLSVALRKQTSLEMMDLSYSEEALDVSSFDIVSPSFSQLVLRGNSLLGFASMRTSFGLKNPASLRTLDLSHTVLQGSVEGSFPGDLTGLQRLNLSHSTNILSSLDSNLFQNNSLLVDLDLSHLQLSGTSTNFFKGLKRLKSLNLQGATLTGDSFDPTIEWKEDPLGSTGGKSWANLSNLKSLQHLQLREAKCESCNVWKQVGTCEAVKHLDLSRSQGFSVDSSRYFKFPNLQSINVSQAVLSKLHLTNFTELKSVDLSGANIDSFAIFGSSKLEQLNFSSSDLGSVTLCGPPANDEFGNKSNLVSAVPEIQSLDFSHVSITTLNLTNLESVKSIDFSHSYIDRLFISNLNSLRQIDMSYASVRVLKVSNLPKLETIDASNMDQSVDLRRLNLNRFKELVDINLSSSKLFSLPDNVFSDLQCVRSLNLSGNFLSQVPKWMLSKQEKCPLTEVDLSNNYLKVLPGQQFKQMIDHSDWTINLGRNILNCSDCRNSWMANKNFKLNLPHATCETPFEYYGQRITDVSIC